MRKEQLKMFGYQSDILKIMFKGDSSGNHVIDGGKGESQGDHEAPT